MPELTIDRVYRAPFFDQFHYNGDSSEIVLARRMVVVVAKGVHTASPIEICCELDPPENALLLTVTTTERRTKFTDLNRTTLDAVLYDVDRAVDQYARQLVDIADELAREGAQTDREVENSPYWRAGFSSSSERWDRSSRHLLQSGIAHVCSGSVTIEVDRRVAAVVREPDRLASLVDRSVVDYSASHGRRVPTLNYRTIAGRPSDPGSASLTISTDDGPAAEEAARALLSPPRRRSLPIRAIDAWPPPAAPYWSTGTMILATFAALIGSFPVNALALTTTVLVLVAVLTATAGLAWKRGADVRTTALGLAPATTIVAFAIFFAANMHGSHPAITGIAAHPHMVDAFMLSFGTASTSGFLDLSLHGTAVRVGAFVEMLVMVSVAGGSLYTASKAAWTKLGEIIRLRSEEG